MRGEPKAEDPRPTVRHGRVVSVVDRGKRLVARRQTRQGHIIAPEGPRGVRPRCGIPKQEIDGPLLALLERLRDCVARPSEGLARLRLARVGDDPEVGRPGV